MSYALIFLQMKGLIKIHNRGKFYEHSIFDCQVINFQSFLYWFSIHEMALFGEVLGPNSPQNCQIYLIFFLQVVFKKQKQYFKNLWKTQIFTETRDIQSLHFWSNFDPFYPPEEDGRNQKKIILKEKLLPLGYPKIAKSRRISSPLQMKNRITFCTFWAFFCENLGEVKS